MSVAPGDVKRCPWCREGRYYHSSIRQTESVECGYCAGTGLYGRWMEHPEYARQRADERLKKYDVVFP